MGPPFITPTIANVVVFIVPSSVYCFQFFSRVVDSAAIFNNKHRPFITPRPQTWCACVRLCVVRSLFSKRWKEDSTFRRDMLKNIPCVDDLECSDQCSDQSEALWKEGLIDEGLLSLLEGDDDEEGAGIGIGVG